MSHFAHTKHSQAGASIPRLFLFAVFGLIALLLSIVFPYQPAAVPTPVMEAVIETDLPLYASLPIALAVPVLPAVIPAKIVPPIVALLVPEDVTPVAEARLIIPSINVNAAIKSMGTTPDGAMAVPNNRFDVGWFNLGTRPGDRGSAVLGGHNRWDQGSGVFEHLDKLQKGEVLSVVDANGVASSFVVRDMRTYQRTDDAEDVFISQHGIHLNLITCSGVFDPSTNTYTTRLIVFTDLVDQLAVVDE